MVALVSQSQSISSHSRFRLSVAVALVALTAVAFVRLVNAVFHTVAALALADASTTVTQETSSRTFWRGRSELEVTTEF